MHAVPLTNVHHKSLIFLEFLKNCLHENISSKSPYRSGFDLSTTYCIWYIILISTWDPFNSFITFRKRYANLVFFDPILAIMTSELELKFQNLWKLYFKICETCIYLPQSFYKVTLSFFSPIVRDIRISTFLVQV